MKRILTGIKPTGEIQLGNYLGMIKNIIDMQNKYEIFLMVANLHAQTVPFDPKEIKRLTYDLVSSFIALGIDPKKTTIFLQSDVPAHLYLYWILGCISPLGDLMRMHEFKEQSQRYKKEGVGAGILMYPVLMAADILIYNADLVPVGEDQRQHVELTRELARKFNRLFGKTFKIPEIFIQPETAKIMSLDNPNKKMSKSLPEGCLEIFADEKVIKEKILKAVTDSGKEIKYDPVNKPAISNLMTIYKYLTKKTYSEIEEEFKGKGYYEFKNAIIDAFFKYFDKVRKIKKKINKNFVKKILKQGADRANKTVNKNLKLILKRTGLILD
ncbi:MAG: tryptophan--tRNA ligase [Minisyncoccia bacterium]